MTTTVKVLKDGVFIDLVSENGLVITTLNPTPKSPVPVKVYDPVANNWEKAVLEVSENLGINLLYSNGFIEDIFEPENLENVHNYDFWVN